MPKVYRFSEVPGFFVDLVEVAKHTVSGRADTQPNFGLLDRAYDTDSAETKGLKQWERLRVYIDRLNSESPPTTSYKLLLLTRHGLGIHNVSERKYGTADWDAHWSHLDGDGTITWVDAQMVPEGIAQAEALSKVWLKVAIENGLPFPTLYTSPLARCLETTKLVFGPLAAREGRPFRPVVKELLRESLTGHTCDRRSSRTWIATHYPDYPIEPGFAENDVLWRAHWWEPMEEHVAREQAVLDEIFAAAASPFVSLTVHSITVQAILEVIGAANFRVEPASTIAFFVKAEKIAT